MAKIFINSVKACKIIFSLMVLANKFSGRFEGILLYLSLMLFSLMLLLCKKKHILPISSRQKWEVGGRDGVKE